MILNPKIKELEWFMFWSGIKKSDKILIYINPLALLFSVKCEISKSSFNRVYIILFMEIN